MWGTPQREACRGHGLGPEVSVSSSAPTTALDDGSSSFDDRALLGAEGIATLASECPLFECQFEMAFQHPVRLSLDQVIHRLFGGDFDQRRHLANYTPGSDVNSESQVVFRQIRVF